MTKIVLNKPAGDCFIPYPSTWMDGYDTSACSSWCIV